MGARRAPCVPICLLAPWVGSVRGASGLRRRQEPPNASLSLRRQRGAPGHVRMFCGGFLGVSQLPVGAVLGGRKLDLGMFCVPPSRGVLGDSVSHSLLFLHLLPYVPSGGSESGRSTPSLSVASDGKTPQLSYQPAPRHFHVPGRCRQTRRWALHFPSHTSSSLRGPPRPTLTLHL